MKHFHKNPRQITEKQFKQLQGWLEEYGDLSGIVHNVRTDEIIGGNQRAEAMHFVGNGAKPVITKKYERPTKQGTVAEGYFEFKGERFHYRQVKWSDKKAEGANVIANKAGGEWDADVFLNSWESSDLLKWGFEQKELEDFGFAFGEEGKDAEPQIDRAAELLKKWKVKTGDLFAIGEHRLICGDCTDAAVVARVMGGEKAGACVTDVPYGQNQIDVDGDEPEDNPDLLCGCVANIPIDNGIVITFESPRTFPNWMQAISGHKFLRALWLYKEAQMANPWRGWILKSEMILISEIGNGEWLDVHPFAHDCYKLSEVSFRTEKIAAVRPHGSVKPLSVVQDLVSRVAGDVYDPFVGSGTTLVACENLHRRCRAIEISPAYCAVTLERMADAFPGIEIKRLK